MTKKSRILRVTLITLALIVLGYLALAFLVILGDWALEAIWAFLSGWVTYPARIIPEVSYNLEMILCGLGALAMALFFAHRFLRWLAEKVPAIPSPWSFRTTAILGFLLLSMFGTSIAMTGIIHQAAWLGTAPELTRNRSVSMTLMQEMSARDLLSELYLKAETETLEHFPKNLIPNEKRTRDFRFSNHLCEYGKGDSESWLFPGSGREFSDEMFPVIISPRPNREEKIVVAYSNLIVKSYPFDDLPPEIAWFFR